MKNFILLFICIIGLNQTQSQNADPHLFDSTWYLNTLSIDGIIYLPPSNDEVKNIPLIFEDDTVDSIITAVCITPTGTLVIDETTLNIDDLFVIGGAESCEETNNFNFERLYLYDFFHLLLPEVTDPIAYEILTDSEENKQLTLTNSNGDIAVYGDQLLAVVDNDIFVFTLATNPVHNVLEINLPDISQNLTIQIYDLTGKMYSKRTNINRANYKEDISSLKSGVYLVVVTDGKNKSVKKFVKN